MNSPVCVRPRRRSPAARRPQDRRARRGPKARNRVRLRSRARVARLASAPLRRVPRKPRAVRALEPSPRARGGRRGPPPRAPFRPSTRASAASFRAASALSYSSASAWPRRANSTGASASPARSCSASRAALGELRDAGISAIEPLAPRRPLGGDRWRRAGARLRLAGERLRRSARFGEFGPLARRGGCARAPGSARHRRSAPDDRARLRHSSCARRPRRARRRRAETASSTADRRDKVCAGLRSNSASGVAGVVRSGAGLARALPAFGLRRGGLLAPRRPRLPLRRRTTSTAWRAASASRIEVAETVLLGEAARGRGRRLRRGDEAVPAPEIAFERDQPLAGLEKPAQRAFRRRAATTPTCARRRASAGGAVTRAASGSTPGGQMRDRRRRKRAATNAPAQLRRASASRSSPSAAPSAAS